MFIFPCVAFSVNLEISFGGGVGGSMEFSYTEGLDTIPSENGVIMRIGNVEIKNNIALAPMAGVTDLPFRFLCKEQGAGRQGMYRKWHFRADSQ